MQDILLQTFAGFEASRSLDSFADVFRAPGGPGLGTT
jgi:hypothetical protein